MATQYWDEADLKALLAGGLINEDVMQRIWDISRIPLPFTDAVGMGTPAQQSFTEWTQDELADPNLTNAVVSGSDASGNDAQGGTRVGNHCQESVKVLGVTERARSSDTIGRADELSYQLMMRQQELRRDVEAISLAPQASVADDNNTTAGQAGGFPSWIETTFFAGTGGAAGGFNTTTRLVDAPTAGAARALEEDELRAAVESVYNENGNPSIIMSVPGVIARLARFLLSGNANVARPTANINGSGGRVDQTSQGYVNVMVTDFGFTLDLMPNRLQQPYDSSDTTPVPVADVFLIDPGFVEHAFLRSYRTAPLAKLGLSDRAQISVDWTLRVGTEKAHGLIRDIDPTLPVVPST